MSTQETLATRASSHGDFIENGAYMQGFKTMCRNAPNWIAIRPDATILQPFQKEAIDMICHKLGRILCGDPNFVDHWHDIAGYATLVENILTTGKSHPTTQTPVTK